MPTIERGFAHIISGSFIIWQTIGAGSDAMVEEIKIYRRTS